MLEIDEHLGKSVDPDEANPNKESSVISSGEIMAESTTKSIPFYLRRLFKIGVSIISLAIILSSAWWAHVEGYLLPDALIPTFGLADTPIEPVFFGMSNLSRIDEYSTCGDLTMIKNGQDPVKIGSNVLVDTVCYLPKSDSILYMTKDNKLYLKAPDKDPEILASDVNSHVTMLPSEDETRVLYVKKTASQGWWDGDLFVIKLNTEMKEKENLGSNIEIFWFLEDSKSISFIEDTKLYIKTEGEEKQKIASSVTDYTVSGDGNTVWYLSQGCVYVKYSDQEFGEKITEEQFAEPDYSLPTPISNGKDFVFMDKYELYFMSKKKAQKLASDVNRYSVTDSNVLFLNRDKELCSVDFSGSHKTKIASDVDHFAVQDKLVIYSIGTNLFVKNGNSENTQIASDIKEWEWTLMSEGIVMLTTDGDLIISDWNGNKTKLGSEIPKYKLLEGDTLVYYSPAHDLFIKKKNQEVQQLSWNMEEYNRVYLLNDLFFQNLLGIKQLCGYWAKKDFPSTVLEFGSDSTIRVYEDGVLDYELPIILTNNTETKATLSYTYNNHKENHDILLHDKDHLTLGQAPYERISLQQFEDQRTTAIKENLGYIDRALNIADRYESNKAALSTMYNNILAGTTNLGEFNSTADLSIGKQRTFLYEAEGLISNLKDPGMYSELERALSLSINSCEAWKSAAFYLWFERPNYAESYKDNAESYDRQAQEILSKLRANLRAEQEKLSRELSLYSV